MALKGMRDALKCDSNMESWTRMDLSLIQRRGRSFAHGRRGKVKEGERPVNARLTPNQIG